MTYTIPIYWGCPNIGKYFDTEGIITFDTVDELIPQLNSLTIDYYDDRVKVIEKNRKIAESYANFSERIKEEICQNL